MGHHHQAADHSSEEQKRFRMHEAPAPAPLVRAEPGEDTRQGAGTPKKSKSWIDFEIAGFPWQFVLVGGAIAAGILGLVLKTAGVF